MRRSLLIAGVLILGAMIAVGLGVANQTRLSGIDVAPGGDYVLNVSQNGGTATLITGSAHAFHLEQDGNANGHRIANVAPGTANGEAFTYGQPISSVDLIGLFPGVTLTNPRVSITDSIISIPLTILAPCTESTVVLPGVAANGVVTATASPTSFGAFGVGVVSSAWISGANAVTIRRCGIVVPTTALGVDVTVGFVP